MSASFALTLIFTFIFKALGGHAVMVQVWDHHWNTGISLFCVCVCVFGYGQAQIVLTEFTLALCTGWRYGHGLNLRLRLCRYG